MPLMEHLIWFESRNDTRIQEPKYIKINKNENKSCFHTFCRSCFNKISGQSTRLKKLRTIYVITVELISFYFAE